MHNCSLFYNVDLTPYSPASTDKGDWITPELLGLWHFHHHASLELEEQLQLISKLVRQNFSLLFVNNNRC